MDRNKKGVVTAGGLMGVSAVALAAGLAAALTPSRPAEARAIGGPYRATNRWLRQGESATFALPFRAGRAARIEAVADGNVDLYVEDPKGVLVVTDRRMNPDAVCRWTPSRTQTYQVTVANADAKPVVFHLETN